MPSTTALKFQALVLGLDNRQTQAKSNYLMLGVHLKFESSQDLLDTNIYTLDDPQVSEKTAHGARLGLRGRGGLHWNMEVYRLRARSTSRR